ncbi:MAG: histidinol dehydrogenase [Alphaproteobacteria bacterium]
MVMRLTIDDVDFDTRFEALLGLKRESDPDVRDTARNIIAQVRDGGDKALIELTRKFDRFEIADGAGLQITDAEIDAAIANVPAEEQKALAHAAERINAFHERQKPSDDMFEDAVGTTLGHRWTPISAVGVYVPGGTASYPSSVLMNTIPAKVAGVPRVAMVVPTPDGQINPLVLLAARLAGVDEVYRIGGAQAVAALAYGTETIAPVDKITGPGNAWVSAAKREVFGKVGIDMIAGPSEILVVADGANDPAWIGADLLSQAEHDTAAQSILITDDAGFADKVAEAVEAHLAVLPRGEIAAQSWADHGAIIVIDDMAQAGPLIDRIAPEHLELAVDDPKAMLTDFSHAGSVFMGRQTPEAVGDYIGGPNHVLPTSRSARFSSGLNVLDFMKRSTLLGCSPEALQAIGPDAVRLAQSEGLGAHAMSVALRLNMPWQKD